MSNGQKIIRRIAGATDIALYTGEHLLIGRPSVFGPEFREMIASHKPGLTERVILNIHKYASHGAGRLHGVLIEIDGIGGVPLSMRGIVERVAGLVRRGTLLALVMPAVALNALTTDSAQLEEMSADLARQEGVNPELSIEGKSFSDLDGMTDKLVYVLKASGKYFKLQSVATAFGKALTATAIISIAVVLAAWAASHFFGVGFAVDVILVAIGFVMMGWAIFSAVRSLWKCVKSIHKAKSLDDLEKAAKMFADTVTQFGVDFFVGLLTRGAGKMRAKKANAKPDAGGGKADTPQKTKAEIEAENKGKTDKAKKKSADTYKVGSNLHGRKITQVKHGSDDPIVLIGTKMDGDDGVIAVAEKLRAEGKKVEILEDGFLNGKKWDIDGKEWNVNSAWDDMVKSPRWKRFRHPPTHKLAGRVKDEHLDKLPMYKLNEQWIKSKNASGATIIDIGNPIQSPSLFYKMEQASVSWSK